jgi:hypothetical protein
MSTLRKARFWAAIAVAALWFLGVAGWANTNANTSTNTTYFEGPRIDPFQIMLNAKNLPMQELEEAVHGL